MLKERRLRKRNDFSALRSGGRSCANRYFVLLTRPNDLTVSRFGFSISKRVGGSVVRNRLKRRLKEIIRVLDVDEGWDVLLIARRDAACPHYNHLRASVADLLHRANIADRTIWNNDEN